MTLDEHSKDAPPDRSGLDFGAAVLAGALAGLAFYALNLALLPRTLDGSPWVVARLLSSPVLGSSVLAPPATPHTPALLVGLLTTTVLAVLFTLLLAFLVHRGGFVLSTLGGALFGVALYAVNFYTFTALFPWFYVITGSTSLVIHALFGALAGFLYEGFEEDPLPDDALSTAQELET